MKYLALTISFLAFVVANSFGQDHAFLGVYSNTIHPQKAKELDLEKPYGAYITSIIGNTTAEKVGLQAFDYLYKIDDSEFTDNNSFHDIMDNYKAGDQATIYYIRDGQELSKQITFGTQADAVHKERDRTEDPFLGIENNHNKPSGVQGVAVNVTENSTAQAMGLQDDDIITQIDYVPMIDWHDIGAAIDNREVGDPITVTYLRDGKITVVTNPIQSLAATKDGYSHGNYSYSYSYNNGHSNNNNVEEENEEEEEMTDLEDMEVEMEEMPVEEAEEMEEELGIEVPVVQNLQIEELNLFPNPTSGAFNLTFDLPEEGQAMIRIFNGQGQVIYNNNLGNFSGNFNEQINLGNEPAGTYYVMIQQGAYSISRKVVISRR